MNLKSASVGLTFSCAPHQVPKQENVGCALNGGESVNSIALFVPTALEQSELVALHNLVLSPFLRLCPLFIPERCLCKVVLLS